MKINLTTVAARAAAAVVAAVAGAASFEHIASVAIAAGERPWVGYSLPLAIDGLIVVGVAALLEDKRNGRAGRMSARLAVAVGVLATLAANVASAQPTWTARLVAVAAPVSFLLAVEVLTRSGRPLKQRQEPATAEPGSGGSATRSGSRRGPTRRSKRTSATAVLAQRPDISPVELANVAGITERHARRLVNGQRTAS